MIETSMGIITFQMEAKFNIPICVPNISGNEGRNLSECIQTKFVSSVGKFVDEFEERLETLSHFKHACAVNSGTSALSLSLHNAGVGSDDLVIIPDYTFIATANAVRHCGALPWLFDIDPCNLNLDIQNVRNIIEKDCIKKDGNWYHKKIGKRLAAVIPVFALGNAINFEELNSLYSDFSIPVIVDGAGALGVTSKAQELGKLNVTCVTISFNGNKTFTSGGGGAILTNDSDFHKLCKHTSTTSRSGYEYIHDRVGFNYRMTNIQAAVGCAQLERYEEFTKKKLDIHKFYSEELNPMNDVFMHEDVHSSRWISYFILQKNAPFNLNTLFLFAQKNGIQLRPFWIPMHLQPPFETCPKEDLYHSSVIYKNVCTLPSSTNISEEEQSFVVKTLNNFFSKN
jgi:perosamine synthetase